jgi:hypothetical protein
MMMDYARTVERIISDVDEICYNAYSPELKTRWISELDLSIWRDLHLLLPAGYSWNRLHYIWPESREVKVIVEPPNDGIYDLYLRAKIEYSNGEYEKYNNTAVMFDSELREFSAWFIDAYGPAQGYCDAAPRRSTERRRH